MSLYFADGENRALRSAIELFNLDNKKRLTPVYMICDYGDGKYVTVELDQPVRVRINHVRGKELLCVSSSSIKRNGYIK